MLVFGVLYRAPYVSVAAEPRPSQISALSITSISLWLSTKTRLECSISMRT